MGVAMLATLGYLVAEPFHPFFNGDISGPANTHLTQVQEVAPFFFAWLGTSIATAEIGRALVGWEKPSDAKAKNLALAEEEGFEGKTWLTKLNDAKGFEEMTNKELSNGRLAMLGIIGMMVQ